MKRRILSLQRYRALTNVRTTQLFMYVVTSRVSFQIKWERIATLCLLKSLVNRNVETRGCVTSANCVNSNGPRSPLHVPRTSRTLHVGDGDFPSLSPKSGTIYRHRSKLFRHFAQSGDHKLTLAYMQSISNEFSACMDIVPSATALSLLDACRVRLCVIAKYFFLS